MSTVTIISREAAALTIIREHESMIQQGMLLIDLIGDFQAGREDARRLKMDNLRRVAGQRFRESIRARHTALMALCPELPPLHDCDDEEGQS